MIIRQLIDILASIFPTSESPQISQALPGNPEMMRREGRFAAGGFFSPKQPMLVGELGPELILPNTGGMVMNAQRTAQIQAAGLQRGAGLGGG